MKGLTPNTMLTFFHQTTDKFAEIDRKNADKPRVFAANPATDQLSGSCVPR